MARSLVDTNILVYSRDLNEPVKRARAIEVIDQLGAGGDLVLSAQCLNEFSSAALRRGTPIAEVRAAVSVWHDLGQGVVYPTPNCPLSIRRTPLAPIGKSRSLLPRNPGGA